MADKEVRRLGQTCLGTENLLLGLAAQKTGIASRALSDLGANLSTIRTKIEEIIGFDPNTAPTDTEEVIKFSSSAQRALEHSIQAADEVSGLKSDSNNSTDIENLDTEHLLLGLI